MGLFSVAGSVPYKQYLRTGHLPHAGGGVFVQTSAAKSSSAIWGEVWWVGEKHMWVFFDDRETSETYIEQLTHCPRAASGSRARTSRR
jgi:hypothetical protein